MKPEAVELSSRESGIIPVWINRVVALGRTRAILIIPQKTAVLRVISAYRTVSDEASIFLSAMPSADLLSLERLKIGAWLRALIL